MTNKRYRIPSTSSLIAFESAARHCNFSRAAEELYTAQSAISRHIADLEARLDVKLFERQQNRRKLWLTEAGEHLHRAVVSGLDTIQLSVNAIARSASEEQITIACTHELSHLYLMPRFEALQATLGQSTQIRIMTYEYDAPDWTLDPRIDLSFTYEPEGYSEDNRVLLYQEAVLPVCSPAFFASHRALLTEDVERWRDLPFLQLIKRNRGWINWEDWFESIGAESISPNYLRYDNYVYLLEAATSGRGIALGWRGLVERYIDMGSLVPLRQNHVEFDHALHAVLTARGKTRTLARRCLEFFQKVEL